MLSHVRSLECPLKFEHSGPSCTLSYLRNNQRMKYVKIENHAQLHIRVIANQTYNKSCYRKVSSRESYIY